MDLPGLHNQNHHPPQSTLFGVLDLWVPDSTTLKRPNPTQRYLFWAVIWAKQWILWIVRCLLETNHPNALVGRKTHLQFFGKPCRMRFQGLRKKTTSKLFRLEGLPYEWCLYHHHNYPHVMQSCFVNFAGFRHVYFGVGGWMGLRCVLVTCNVCFVISSSSCNQTTSAWDAQTQIEVSSTSLKMAKRLCLCQIWPMSTHWLHHQQNSKWILGPWRPANS